MNLIKTIKSSAIIATALAAVATTTFAAVCEGPSPVVKTDKGAVAGVYKENGGSCAFKGVPFAAPPVGDLRFAMPAPHQPWEGARDASKYAEQCVQHPLSLFPSDKVTGSEDCLYLNVWAPASADPGAPRPVMFFIHGGGFLYGSGAQDTYEGDKLSAMRNVIVVTTNYRLGPFGFLTHPELKDSAGRVGNYGMYDQVAALQWVKDNIRNFGGDPDNVTIFGESAGGMSVGALLVAPPARGLFHKAIIESGPVVVLNTSLKRAEEDGAAAAKNLGCADSGKVAECLRALPAAKILQDVPATIAFIQRYEAKGAFQFMPTAGTEFLPDLPLKLFNKGLFDTNVPVIIGTNRDEASYFTSNIKIENQADYDAVFEDYSKVIKKNFDIDALTSELKTYYPLDAYPSPKKAFNDVFCDIAFTCPSRLLANVIQEKGGKVYIYHFIKPPQEDGMMKDWGAFHGAELPFIFGNFTFMGIKFSSPENKGVASRVMSLWSGFAETGVPSVQSGPAWPLYNPASSEYLEIGKELTVKNSFKNKQCGYLQNQIMKLLE